MKSTTYIKTELEKILDLFPQMQFMYEYDAFEQTHIIEVIPLEIYENNDEYKKAEANLSYTFDRRFAPETVLFVSEDSLIRVSHPTEIFQRAEDFSWSQDLDDVPAEDCFTLITDNLPRNGKQHLVFEPVPEYVCTQKHFPENAIKSGQICNYALAA